MGVSNGGWSNEPVSYAYQWQDCNSTGEKCTAIPGATNANYKVAKSDVGHALTVAVTATTAGGYRCAQARPAAWSGLGTGPNTRYPKSDPTEHHARPRRKPVVHRRAHSKIGKITTSGTNTEYALPAKATPRHHPGPGREPLVHRSNTSKIGKITTSGAITEYALPAGRLSHRHHAGPRREPLVHRVGHQQDRQDHDAGAITEYALPDRKLARSASRRARTGTSGSPTRTPARSARSRPRARSPNTPCPRAAARTDHAGPRREPLVHRLRTSKIGKITTAGAITEYSAARRKAIPGHHAGP